SRPSLVSKQLDVQPRTISKAGLLADICNPSRAGSERLGIDAFGHQHDVRQPPPANPRENAVNFSQVRLVGNDKLQLKLRCFIDELLDNGNVQAIALMRLGKSAILPLVGRG